MDRGDVNPTQHLPWRLRETSKRTLITLVSTGIWTRNAPNTSPMWWILIGAMFCAFKNDQRPRFTVGGCWNKSLQLDRCNDATVRTREVTLVHASYDVIFLSRTYNKWFNSCETSGKLTSCTPLVYFRNINCMKNLRDTKFILFDV